MIVVSHLVDILCIEAVVLRQQDMRRSVHPLGGGSEDRQWRRQGCTLVLCNTSDKNIRKRKAWLKYCSENKTILYIFQQEQAKRVDGRRVWRGIYGWIEGGKGREQGRERGQYSNGEGERRERDRVEEGKEKWKGEREHNSGEQPKEERGNGGEN